MAKKIQMWTEFGPKLAPATPIAAEEVIEQLVQATNQTRGSILAVLSELDEVILQGLRSGRIVKLPNGTNFRPIGKKDGSIKVSVRLNPRLTKQIAAERRANWVNAQNIGKSEAEMIALWNEAHPDDPIEE
jgi:hypothetical protein